MVYKYISYYKNRCRYVNNVCTKYITNSLIVLVCGCVCLCPFVCVHVTVQGSLQDVLYWGVCVVVFDTNTINFLGVGEESQSIPSSLLGMVQLTNFHLLVPTLSSTSSVAEWVVNYRNIL